MPTPAATKVPAKAPASKKSAPEADEPEASSTSALMDMVKEHKSEHFVYVQPKHQLISTGSLILDSLCKVRSGSVVRLVGKGAELGKSSQGFVFMANYLATMPKAKGLYFKAEARLTPEIRKRSGLKWVDRPEDWVAGTVFVYPVNVFEVMAETLERLLPQMHELDEHLCVMIDSLDGLMLRADKAKALWADDSANVKVAGVPKLTKELFRRLGLPIVHYDVLMLVTGQYSAAISLDPYAAKEHRQAQTSGGNAISHQADYVFEYQPRLQGDKILEKPKEKPDWRTNKELGVNVTIDIKKSGTDVTGARPKVPIRKGRVGSAIWVEREIGDMLLQWALLTPKKDPKTGKPGGGAWVTFDPRLRAEIKAATGVEMPEHINGLNNVYAELEKPEAKPAVAYLFEYFRKLVGGEDAPTLAATTVAADPATEATS